MHIQWIRSQLNIDLPEKIKSFRPRPKSQSGQSMIIIHNMHIAYEILVNFFTKLNVNSYSIKSYNMHDCLNTYQNEFSCGRIDSRLDVSIHSAHVMNSGGSLRWGACTRVQVTATLTLVGLVSSYSNKCSTLYHLVPPDGGLNPWIFVVTRWLKAPPESQNFANPPYSGSPSEIEVPQDLTRIQSQVNS